MLAILSWIASRAHAGGSRHPRSPRALAGDLANLVPAACRVPGFPRSAPSLSAPALSIWVVGDVRPTGPRHTRGWATDGTALPRVAGLLSGLQEPCRLG